jgi:autotransporter-associated beta strand protein
MTNPGQNYTAGDVLTFNLSGGGASTPATSYTYTLASADLQANNGGLTALGTGTLILTGTNTYTGTTNISAGTLQLAGTGTLGTGPVSIGTGAFLSLNNSLAVTIPNAISGAGGVQQITSFATTLTGASTYTGTTNISAGTLVLASTASLGNTAVTVAGGATLNTQTGSGTMNIGTGTASLTLAPGSNLDMTDGATGTLKLNGSGGMTIGAATGAPAVLTFEFGNSATDQIVTTGPTTVLASGAKIDLVPISGVSSLSTGVTYPLITASSLSSNNGGNFSLGYGAIDVNGHIYDISLVSSATSEGVSFTSDTSSVVSAFWSGALNGTWNSQSGAGAPTNWCTDASGATDTLSLPGPFTNVYFSINGGGSNQSAINLGANTSINTLSFTNSGSSTPINISGYTLTIGNAPTLDTTSSGSGITVASGAPAVTINSGIALGGSQTWVSNSSNPLVINGVVSGSAGSILTVAPGSGAITLAGSNTFAGGLNAAGGTLNINNPGALGAGTFTITGPVVLDNTTGAAETLTVAKQAWNSSFTFNGTNDLNLGAGNVSLGASVTVTLNAGNLTMGGTLTDNNSGYTLTSSGAGNLNLTGNVSGGISLVATGPGLVNVTSTGNTFTGNTNVAGGTLNFTGAAAYSGGGALLVGAGSSTSAVANFNSSGTMVYNTAATAGYSGYGAINQYNGTFNLTPNGSLLSLGGAGYLEVGVNPGQFPTAYGSYLMAGGTLNTLGATGIRVGDGGYGVFTQTGGVINITRYFAMTSPGNGAQSGGYSIASFLGGVFNGSTGGYNVRIADDAYGTSVLSIGSLAGGSALFNLSGSTDGGLFELTDGNSVAGSYAIANLNAGTVRFNGALGLFKGSYYTNANLSSGAIVNLNGATLQAGVNNLSFIDNTVDAAYVYNGNAVFDTNNYSGGKVTASLLAPAGLGIYTPTFNIPTGSQGSGYIGTPIVTLPGGSGNSQGQQQYATAISNVVNGQVTSVTITDPGQGYNVGDTINFNFAGGTQTTPASYSYTLTAADLVQNNLGGVVKNGLGDLTLSGSNTYLGPTQANAGTLIFGNLASMPVNNNLNINSGASIVTAAHASNVSAPVFQVGTLTNSGVLDIKNNSMVISNNSIGQINAMLAAGYNGGRWNGTGGAIESSTAAANTTHLTAVGSMTGVTSFGGLTVSSSAVELKYTYYGDANLDGQVNSADYTLIDAGFLSRGALTGWQNGDFNYDGVINGSDYTLIDNAFNQQAVQLSTEIASPTAQLAGAGASSAVPEPASLSLLGLGAMGLLGRRRRGR